MRVYLVRHGLTIENVKGIVAGADVQGTLTRNGIVQAKDAGNKLKSKKVGAIYSSDLRRAKHTARHIARHHRGIRVVYTPELREYRYGKFDGVALNDAERLHLLKLIYDTGSNRKGVETVAQAYSRISRFIAKMEKKHKGDTIILVSHGGISRVITAVLRGIPKGRVHKVEGLKNAEIRYFKI